MFGLDRPRALAVALVGTLIGALGARFSAADPAGFVPRDGGSQFMLYVSRPLGLRGAAVNTFGLRYESASPGSTDPAARFCAPIHHRALIDLQLVRGATPRMLFGPRVTWDIGRRQLGPTNLNPRSWPLTRQPLAVGMLAAWVP